MIIQTGNRTDIPASDLQPGDKISQPRQVSWIDPQMRLEDIW